MATYQAVKVSSTTEQMPGVGDGQSAKVAASNFVFATAPATNDIIQGPLIQIGSVITDITVVTTGFGTASVISVGTPVAGATYFINNQSGVAAGVIRMSAATALPYVVTTNERPMITINTAGATAAGTVSLIVTFLPRNA